MCRRVWITMGFVLESLLDQERDQENTRRRRHGDHDHGGEYLHNPKLGISQLYYIIYVLYHHHNYYCGRYIILRYLHRYSVTEYLCCVPHHNLRDRV